MMASNDAQPAGARQLVVFLVWRSLPYAVRMALSFILILAGLVIQLITGSFLLGLAPLATGNILLLVRGYDNRVDVQRFTPGANWERVERARLDEVISLDKSIRQWDRSLIDATNYLGAAAMLMVVALLGIAAWFLSGFARIIAIDAILLLLPHWFTGIRRVLRLPKIVVRAETIAQVLDGSAEIIRDDKVDIMMLLKGKEVQVPDDIKFRINFVQQVPDFLGLYGQVVINDVQGRSYPYFYIVIVAKKGYGLRDAYDSFNPPDNTVKEFDTEGEVEFTVIRQKTTKTSGYHTKPSDAQAIFTAGYHLARQSVTAEVSAPG